MTTESEPRSNVSTDVISQAVSSLDKYILDHYGKPSRRTLRERQITVVEDLRDTLREGQTEGYVTIPTGVGKTVLFTEVTEALNEQEILETMIVVPTKILVDQTAERFHQFAPDLQVGKLYSNDHDITRPVTITTYASLVRHIQDGTLDARLYKLLVLDEVHRSLSGKRIQAVAQFTGSIKLGFTATPMYSEDRQVANLLNTEIHRMSIREAVEENLLSPFSAIIAETEVDLSNITIKSTGDYDDKELEDAINISSRNQAAVDLYNKLFQGQTAVAYCTSVKHAQDLARIFNENGVSADFVSGYQDKKEQANVLRRYHEGKIKVLCNADILIEGFDEPRVSVCFNVRPTHSLVVAQQRAGRVLRLDPDNPNKHATVVDFLDKTGDPRKLPVTFAEVAEAAFITTKRLGGKTVDLSIPKAPTPEGRIDTGIVPNEDVIEISGLKVIVNPREVMNIVKEIQEKEYLETQETDLPLTYDSLTKQLIGDWVKVSLIAQQVKTELEREHPEYFARRLNKPSRKTPIIDVVTIEGKQAFIEAMLLRNIRQQEINIQPLQITDLPLTREGLMPIFISERTRLNAILEQVKNEIMKKDPQYFIRRRNGSNFIYVVAAENREEFIKAMIDRGIEVHDKSIQNLKEKDLPLSANGLRSVFRGQWTKLAPKAQIVRANLEFKHPEYFARRKSGKIYVDVITSAGKEAFIKRMVNLGAKQKG